MRHTTLTQWIETADARQMCLEAATRAHPHSHRRVVKIVLRAAVLAVPVALAVIGSTAALSTLAQTPASLNCSGFPAVACHPAQITSLSLST